MEMYQKTKAKQIIADREKIKKIVSETIDKMATIVAGTLGPGGNTVLIERDGQSPISTKDGVTVAKALGVANSEENVIIEAAKEICLRTAREAGDGTTTSLILANSIIKAGHEFLSKNPKYNSPRVINELQVLFKKVVEPYLKEKAIHMTDDKQLLDVAKISANGDESIANVVVKAVLAAGEDGTVLLEESQSNETRVETIDGYVITSGLKDVGPIGMIFINDRTNQQCKMDKGITFLYNGSITDLKALAYVQGVIENTELFGSPLIIMAHEFSDMVLDKIAGNVKGGLTICPIVTPRSGMPNSKTMFLHDMAAYTGAKVFDPGNIADITINDFGSFEVAKCNTYETFIQCSPQTEAIDARIEELKGIAKTCFSDFDRMFVKAAIGKLTGGIATIFIGGSSDLEIREKKARVEDAVEAARSAIAEGIVAGGCLCHRELIEIIKNHADRKPSWEIMENALKEPFKILIENCGEDVLEIEALLLDNKGMIFDANEHKVVDPFESGVIEPAKVIRVSLSNALSVANLLMTLSGIVCVPRDVSLENQMELSKSAFKDLMANAGQQ